MNESASIAVVFATMGRPAVAAACVRALAAQTRVPDLVVLALNDPADGTREAIAGLGSLPFEIILHAMAENRGNAGGVEEAMALAMAKQAAYVWVLDDDSWPRPDALAALAAAGKQPDTVVHPMQIDPRTNEIAWPVVVREPGMDWRMIDRLGDMPEQEILESRPSWTGALLPRAAIEAAGPVRGDLFIRGEDDEYSLRVADHGFRYFLVRAAVLDHPGPLGMVSLRVFGKRFFWEPELAEWKLFYKVRNHIWLQSQRQGVSMACMALLAALAAMLQFDTWSFGRFRVFTRAAADGLAGRLGRTMVPPAPAQPAGNPK